MNNLFHSADMRNLILLVLFFLLPAGLFSQDLGNDYNYYLSTAKKHQQLGNMEKAIANYKVYKEMTGQTDKDLEILLKSEKNSGKGIVSATPQSYVEDAGCGLNMKMVYVEGGSFRMGATPEQGSDAYSNESPVHTVRLDSYYMAECEVTQAQWEKIMGTTIYQQRDKMDTQWLMCGVGDNNPMYYVNWEEAQAFCRELSAMTGKTYLLPTEAQWEYAARGGNKSKGYKYSGSYAIDAVAWYASNSGSATTRSGTTHWVKQKRANELGLYDMSGNVYEWCSDWYGSYSSSEQSNPTGAGSGQDRVLRGGGWIGFAGYCRVSYRYNDAPSSRYGSYGFRVVCLP